MSTDTEKQAQASYWFSRQQGNPLSAREQQHFDQWLTADPQHATLYQHLQKLWASPAFADSLKSLESEIPLPAAPQRRNRLWRYSVASAAMLLIALGITWQSGGLIAWQADYLNQSAQPVSYDLPDGSTILLGSRSAIAIDMEGNRRHLKLLAGDLFVNAAKDLQRPLRVEAGGTLVEVTGTRFAVRKREQAVAVAVEEGRVEVTDQQQQRLSLGAGEYANTLQGILLQGEGPDYQQSLDWVNGRLSFRNQPLAEVMQEINRHRSGALVVVGSSLRDFPVSGHYRLDDPDSVVRSLTQVASARIRVLPGIWLVSEY